MKIIYENCGVKNNMKEELLQLRKESPKIFQAFFSQLQKLRLQLR